LITTENISDKDIADKLTKFNNAINNKYTMNGYQLKKNMDEIIPKLSKDYKSGLDYYGIISNCRDENDNHVWIVNILECIVLIINIIIIIYIALHGKKIKLEV